MFAGSVLSIVVAIRKSFLLGLPLNLAVTLLGILCMRQGVTALRETVAQPPEIPTSSPDAVIRSPQKLFAEYWLPSAGILGLLAFVLFVYWSAHRAHLEQVARDAQQNDAIRAAKRVGGVVGGWRDSTVTAIGLQRADAQTQSFEGRQFGNRDPVDDDLHVLSLFPELEDVTVISPEVTNAGLLQLPLKLTRLVVQCPQVTERGLAVIADMHRLESLNLEGCRLRTLSSLGLDKKPLLQNLNLANTQLTSEGAAPLAFLKKVTTLDLTATAIDDECLAILAELSDLKELRLDATLITDEGLSRLRSLTKLKWLYAAETGVTSEGRAELHRHLPNCEIYIKSLNVPPGTLVFPVE